MMRNWKTILALLLALALLLPLAPRAAAEEVEENAEAAPAGGDPRFDGKTWQEIMDDFFTAHGTNPDKVACGWCNIVTGEEQYHNGDQYMVSASMYKVPMNMIFAEKLHNGEIGWDTFVGSYQYKYALYATIVDSNNDVARSMWKYLGGYQAYRRLLAPYMGEDPDTVDQKFYENNFSTPRQMIYALKLLYTEPDRFPEVLNTMLQAEPNKYFKVHNHDFEIAHKYGYLTDGPHFYLNDCAICFTDEPMCIVIFTDNVVTPYEVLADFCDLMIDYTQYSTAARKEAERIAAEEAAIAALNQAEAAPEETPAPASAGETAPTETAATPQPTAAPAPTAEKEREPGLFWPVTLGICTLALAAWLSLRAICRARRGKLSLPWALAAVLFGAAAILVCLLPGERKEKAAAPAAAAEDSATSAEAQAAVTEFFDSLIARDYERAYARLSGVATLGLEDTPANEDAARLMDAVRASWSWRLYGDCSLTRSGATQQVVFNSLDLSRMRDDIRAATEAEVERLAAELPADEIYAEDGGYLPSFTERAYAAALEDALAHTDEYYAATGLNIRLVKDGGEWLIVPDSALYGALTGGAVR